MKYGIDFDCPDIPEHYRRRFRERRVIPPASAPSKKRTIATLVGVAEQEDELRSMLLVADNGHRKLWTVRTVGATAIYVY